MRVEYLDDSFIKKRANILLKGYDELSKMDVEGIATHKLGLKIRFMDLKAVYGKETLGMIIPEFSHIICDNSLEPHGKNKETKEHIFRFTIAHEIGHFTLHNKYMENIESPIFHKNLPSHENKRLETQANMLAAELLMPEEEFGKAYNHLINFENLTNIYDIKYNLSKIFNVSMQAAGYKINRLKL